eukprot:TRINITY_DN200_c2_g1_i1.p1 TRINITY_DN200_c2_g1~~TRINITY_DN200_c2_g1_i1.p1  ORF type:complete len:289 (+),score=94.53 TRINITY_DN200_c2_g1_i1:71-937(+)
MKSIYYSLFAILLLFINISYCSQLYGVTGERDESSETLFTIDTDSLDSDLFLTLGNGDNGEAIEYNDFDGLLHHWSGSAPHVMETINLRTKEVRSVTLTGETLTTPIAAAAIDPITENFLVSTTKLGLYYITPNGFVVSIDEPIEGQSNLSLKGLVFSNSGNRYYACYNNNLDLEVYDSDDFSLIETITIDPDQNIGATGCNGLDRDQDTGDIFIILTNKDTRDNYLAVLDTDDGDADILGLLDRDYASIAFAPESDDDDIFSSSSSANVLNIITFSILFILSISILF